LTNVSNTFGQAVTFGYQGSLPVLTLWSGVVTGAVALEFNANLQLKALGLSALDKLKEISVDGKATNATLEIDLAEHKVPPGTYSLYLQTQTPGKYRNNPEAAKAADGGEPTPVGAV
jgi:hypothetical protein